MGVKLWTTRQVFYHLSRPPKPILASGVLMLPLEICSQMLILTNQKLTSYLRIKVAVGFIQPSRSS